MKKIIFILLTIFVLTGCSSDNKEIVYTNNTETSLVLGNGTWGQSMTIYEYEYKGHKYQYHRLRTSHGGQGGPVHDPNCPCFMTDSIN